MNRPPVTSPATSDQPVRIRAALHKLAESRAQILAVIAVVAIAAGFLLHALGAGDAGHQVWRAAVALLAAIVTAGLSSTWCRPRSGRWPNGAWPRIRPCVPPPPTCWPRRPIRTRAGCPRR